MGSPGSGGTPRRVAAFDFDGTVSRRDTLVPFLASAAGPRRFAAACSRVGLSGARRRVELGDRDAVKAELIRLLFAGRAEDDLRELGARYAARLLDRELRDDVVRRIEAHRGAGHETLFVSASLVYYLEPLAESLGVDHVIAVEPEVRDGRLTGDLARPNVRAEQKAVRLREWLGQPPTGPMTAVELWAYGNSSGDHELLSLADERRRYWLGRASKCPTGVEVFSPASPAVS